MNQDCTSQDDFNRLNIMIPSTTATIAGVQPQPVSPITTKRKLEQDFELPAFDSSWHSEDDDWALFCPAPSKRIRQHCGKTVRFARHDEVFDGPALATAEDLANAWYTPSDWMSFKADCRATVAAIIKANGDLSCLDLDQHCIHGLEEYTARCMMGRSRSPRQRMIVRQIILVQQWQRKKGIADDAAIKNAYLRLSQKHRTRAVRRASFNSNSFRAQLTAVKDGSAAHPIECN